LLLLSLRPPAVLLQQQRQGKRTNQSHAGLGWGLGETTTGGTMLSVKPCNEPTPASFVVVVSSFFFNKKKRLKECTKSYSCYVFEVFNFSLSSNGSARTNPR
jgi:hypothetical protein